MDSLLSAADELFGAKLFMVGNARITVAALAMALLILIVARLISLSSQRVVDRAFELRDLGGTRSAHVVGRVLHYGIMLFGVGLAVDSLGVDLAALFAAGAIFAVGLGFAMQSITQNFVSGVILLVERSVSVGDILDISGKIVRVEDMGLRSTIVRTRDFEQIVVPNSHIVQNAVTNYTLQDSLYRLKAKVGVSYHSDMKQVIEVLETVANAVPWRSARLAPQVEMVDFGSSSVDFEIWVWIEDPWSARTLLSKLNQQIWWALKKEEIVIAFPQLDVHFDPNALLGRQALSNDAS